MLSQTFFLLFAALVTLSSSVNAAVLRARATSSNGLDIGTVVDDVAAIINAGTSVMPYCQTEENAVNAVIANCPSSGTLDTCVCESANLQVIIDLFSCTVRAGVSIYYAAGAQAQDLANICGAGGSTSSSASQGVAPLASSTSSFIASSSSAAAIVQPLTTSSSVAAFTSAGSSVKTTATTTPAVTSNTAAGSAPVTTSSAAKTGGAISMAATGSAVGSILLSLGLIAANFA